MNDERGRMVQVKRVANIYDDLKPTLWTTGKVAILRDRSISHLGFYCAKADRYRDELPVEIFNHQLADLDIDDLEELAAFMSEYGMFFDSWPGSTGEMAQYNKFVNVSKWGWPSRKDIDLAIALLDANFTSGSHTSEGRRRTYELWRGEYERMYQCAGEDWSSWELFEPRLFLVSHEEVRENINLVFSLVNLAKAAAQSEDESEIAQMIGVDRADFFDEILYLDHTLNALLHTYQPKVGFQYIVDGVAGRPTYYCDMHDLYDSDGPMPATLMNAIALQIRDFNIRLSEARQCSECGQIFIAKQSARPKSRAHSDSTFCCDRCKNRSTQRRYRESPGYKQKRARKKEQQ